MMMKRQLPTARCGWIFVESLVDSRLALVFYDDEKAIAHRRVRLNNCRKPGEQPPCLSFYKDEKTIAHRQVCPPQGELAEEGAGLVVVGKQDGYFIIAL